MRLEHPTRDQPKGWSLGPWNSNLDLSIGYANAGIDEPHLHEHTTEIYLIARGTSEIRIETQTVSLAENDILVIEPGEAHTFLSSSPDYFHFVLHFPTQDGHRDKMPVAPSRLGL